MIRAVLVTVIALVATWSLGVLFHDRSGENRHRQPMASLEDQGTRPVRLESDVVHPANIRKHPHPTSTPSDLTLKAVLAPVPRPAKVKTSRPLPRPATPSQIVNGAPVPVPPASLRNASDLSCIAVAIYHEARDQEDFGQRAVASVILQRAAVPHRWGDTACNNVVPTQFSFMTSRYDFAPIDDLKAWEKAVRFAARALLEGPMPELKGADHYHTTAVLPKWAPRMDRVQLIDDHVFYVDPRSSFSL
ncbi:MAG: cell wall hydrolase [Alphaproteobacteria bacterium]|nr:cell wall hydrolase [Alphaproteobacteria bacterium]